MQCMPIAEPEHESSTVQDNFPTARSRYGDESGHVAMTDDSQPAQYDNRVIEAATSFIMQ
jgi:hypothetical protein